MRKIADFRNLAAECVRLAHNARTERNKLRLLDMAARWEELADSPDSSDESSSDVIVHNLRRPNGEPLN